VCQAIDLRGNKGLGKGTKPAYETLRKLVPMLEDDRPLYEDINKCESIIVDESLIKNVEAAVGKIEF
ncbi:MAG: histidine ammonia-lyase, partial [Proteocatella sp.]